MALPRRPSASAPKDATSSAPSSVHFGMLGTAIMPQARPRVPRPRQSRNPHGPNPHAKRTGPVAHGPARPAVRAAVGQPTSRAAATTPACSVPRTCSCVSRGPLPACGTGCRWFARRRPAYIPGARGRQVGALFFGWFRDARRGAYRLRKNGTIPSGPLLVNINTWCWCSFTTARLWPRQIRLLGPRRAGRVGPVEGWSPYPHSSPMSGKLMRNVVPSSDVLCTSIVPPACLTMPSAIERPTPVDFDSGLQSLQ